ncbi:iqgap- protein [Malassezia sp. CBS 17886]|nr:iqgap- protein [Malassezia sp. CBS 17886]
MSPGRSPLKSISEQAALQALKKPWISPRVKLKQQESAPKAAPAERAYPLPTRSARAREEDVFGPVRAGAPRRKASDAGAGAAARDPLAARAEKQGARPTAPWAARPTKDADSARPCRAAPAGQENAPADTARHTAATQPAKESSFAAAKRLFNAAVPNESAGVARGMIRRDSESGGVLGTARVRFSRQSLAPATVAAEAPGGTKWMDKGRGDVQAYEYLCHCSEAQQWIERCIGEPLGGDIANMGEEMRNGIALAKLAKSFEPACVPRIFVHPRLQFRHTDNINYYFQFVDNIRLPGCFRFELTDLYEKKNFPKVVYCLHALSHFMAHHGRADKVDDLVGKLSFDDMQLDKTQKSLDAAGGALPSFGGVGQALAQEIGASGPTNIRTRADGDWIRGGDAGPGKALPPAELPKAAPAAPVPAPNAAPPALGPVAAARAALRHVEPAPPPPPPPAPSMPSLRSPDKTAQRALERQKERARDGGMGDAGVKKEAARIREERERKEQSRARTAGSGRAPLATANPPSPASTSAAGGQRVQDQLRARAQELAAARARRTTEANALRDAERARERQRADAERERERERREQEYRRERARTQLEHEKLREADRAREHAMELRAERERAERESAAREEAELQRAIAYERERKEQLERHAAELEKARAETAAMEARLAALEADGRAAVTERRAAEEAAAAQRAAEERVAAESAAEESAAAKRAAAAEHAAAARAAEEKVAAESAAEEKVATERAAAAEAAAAESAAAAAAERAAEQAAAEAAAAEQAAAEAAAAAAAEARAAGHLIIQVQAQTRGVLLRQRFYGRIEALDDCEPRVVALQAHLRGALARRRLFAELLALERRGTAIVGIQSSVRALLAKRMLLARVQALRAACDGVCALQAAARGALARRRFARLRGAFRHVEVEASVHQMQTSLRAALSRRRHRELQKEIAYVTPDVAGVQAAVRGVLARREFTWWCSHLHASAPVAVHLQSLSRGLLARRAFRARWGRYLAQLPALVELQSLVRGRQQAHLYRALCAGRHVPLAAVRAYAPLLDAHAPDFAEELNATGLRVRIVQQIRENQGVERDVAELDVKIALLVKNKIGIEEVVRAKTERGLLGAREAETRRMLAAAGDPFVEQVLDRAGARRLALYQALFYLLQTRPAYVARLLVQMSSAHVADADRRQLEQTVLTLFHYAQHPREEFLLLQLLARSIQEQLAAVPTPAAFATGHAQFLKLVALYSRGVQETAYLARVLAAPVRRVATDASLDLETDPRVLAGAGGSDAAAARITPAALADPAAALDDPVTRTRFIHHLQALRSAAEHVLQNLWAPDAPAMPYGLRFVARAIVRGLQERFPDEARDELLRTAGSVVYMRYLHPALLAPESVELTDHVLGAQPRRNLAAIATLLAQITRGDAFDDSQPYLQPLNEFVQQAGARYRAWLGALADSCEDAELHFGPLAYVDQTGPQKPAIFISPNEIYAMQQLLCNNVDSLAPDADDPLRALLAELGAAPVSTTRELDAARNTEVSLALSSALTGVADVDEEGHLLFVETKRLLLTVLQVQARGASLLDVLVAPVTAHEEERWAALHGDGAAFLPDLGETSFAELKAATLEHMLQLERLGRVHRANAYQDMVDALAQDICGRHRRREQRRAQLSVLQATLRKLAQQRAFMEEQLQSYHSYIDRSMQGMQKRGRRRFVLPFTQQFFHQRSLKAAGVMPKFGSFRYSAQRLQDRGVLLAIEGAAVAMEQVAFSLASDEPGVFSLEAFVSGIPAGTAEIRMEQLLEAQYNAQSTIGVLDDTIKLSVDRLIHLINKRFYV